MPTSLINTSHFCDILNIKLADPDFNLPGVVDVLLGADIFANILRTGRRCQGQGLPVALDTMLG